jgi:hypothetical protein
LHNFLNELALFCGVSRVCVVRRAHRSEAEEAIELCICQHFGLTGQIRAGDENFGCAVMAKLLKRYI